MSETQKHVTVQAKYVSECVHHWIITLVYVPIIYQHANIFTKPLGGQAFRLHMDVIMSISHAKLPSSSTFVVTAGASPTLSLTVGASTTSQLIKPLAQCSIKMSERNVLCWTLLLVKALHSGSAPGTAADGVIGLCCPARHGPARLQIEYSAVNAARYGCAGILQSK